MSELLLILVREHLHPDNVNVLGINNDTSQLIVQFVDTLNTLLAQLQHEDPLNLLRDNSDEQSPDDDISQHVSQVFNQMNNSLLNLNQPQPPQPPPPPPQQQPLSINNISHDPQLHLLDEKQQQRQDTDVYEEVVNNGKQEASLVNNAQHHENHNSTSNTSHKNIIISSNNHKRSTRNKRQFDIALLNSSNIVTEYPEVFFIMHELLKTLLLCNHHANHRHEHQSHIMRWIVLHCFKGAGNGFMVDRSVAPFCSKIIRWMRMVGFSTTYQLFKMPNDIM